MARIELGHLHLLALAGSGVGGTLAVRAGPAELRQGGELALARLGIHAGIGAHTDENLERAVHGNVGITADGRREVAVRRGAKGIVAIVSRQVDGSLLSPEQ